MSERLDALAAFVAVANERSFTKAAATLGLSSSALSHTIRGLEERLGIRLLARTTRHVSPTEAGQRLLDAVGPHLEGIAAEIGALSELRDRPAGTIRITCIDSVMETLLRPKLPAFLYRYPDIKVELIIDYGFTNIVEQRIDAGVRVGEALSKDMIAVRIGRDWRFSIVASPAYFARYAAPLHPKELTGHNCVNMRLMSAGTFYAWEFDGDEGPFSVRVSGQFACNSTMGVLRAALDGLGVACVPEALVKDDVSRGNLVEVLADWCPTFEGHYLYYPNRRQASPAFQLLVKELTLKN